MLVYQRVCEIHHFLLAVPFSWCFQEYFVDFQWGFAINKATDACCASVKIRGWGEDGDVFFQDLTLC
jgi:hypothetical protein